MEKCFGKSKSEKNDWWESTCLEPNALKMKCSIITAQTFSEGELEITMSPPSSVKFRPSASAGLSRRDLYIIYSIFQMTDDESKQKYQIAHIHKNMTNNLDTSSKACEFWAEVLTFGDGATASPLSLSALLPCGSEGVIGKVFLEIPN